MSPLFRRFKWQCARSGRNADQSRSDYKSSRQRWLNLAMLVVLMACGVVYLFQINSLSTKGYQMHLLEKEIATLQTSNDKLEMQTIEARSLRTLQGKINTLGLVSANDPVYLAKASMVATAQ